jgi:large subunit ribosomal protein L16
MLQPKKTKFRKMQKGKMKGNAQRGHQLAFGSYGIKALEEVWITARQIEAARVAMTRYMKRAGRVWVRIFPDIPVSKKPTEVRMGKGKGSPEYWVVRVKPGKIMFEVDGVSHEIAKAAFSRAAAKLPVKTKVVEQLIK